jgi:hypothetical protein
LNDARPVGLPKPTIAYWRALLYLNLAILIGFALYKLFVSPLAGLAYVHLLVDYHFGLIKRALIGAVLGLAFGTVPPWVGKALGLFLIVLNFVLFSLAFRKSFGFSRSQIPLYVFMLGSPFFLKNFLHTIGYFDIYGCTLAFVLLLLPARSFLYVAVAGLGCVALLLIHHLHALLYVPAIFAIVGIRYYLPRPVTAPGVVAAATMCLALAAACIVIQFRETVPVPLEEFTRHLQTRVAPGGPVDALSFTYVWYRPLSEEIRDSWENFGDHWKGWYLAYPLLVLVHWPLIRFMRRSVLSITSAVQRRAVAACFVVVTLGYVVLCGIAFDYARFVSNWAVCMMLVFLAARSLDCEPVAPIDAEDRATFTAGFALSLIPRVGIITAFNL